MTYTPEQISQIVLKVLKEIEEPNVLELPFDEKIKLAKDPNTSQETLAILATDKDADVRYWVAKHPNTSQESLDVLATDKDSDVRFWVAKHPNTSQETLAVLATDKDADVRIWVAQHLNTSQESLAILATDENSSVRRCAAENPNYKKQVLELNTNMNKYRIKKVTQGDATAYHPQEKFGWFWFDMDMYGFDTYEQAQKALCNYLKEPFPSVEYLEFDPAKNCK